METERGQVSLANLGRDYVHPEREEQARVAAFLHVPLYRAIFDKYRGHLLPPDVGLERQMIELGVAEKQTDKARQALRRSAEHAGFFAQGRDRLVLPAGVPTKELEPREEEPRQGEGEGGGEQKRGSGDGGPPPDLHPFILGLLQTLPEPGSHWSQSQLQRWLDTASNICHLIYDIDEAN